MNFLKKNITFIGEFIKNPKSIGAISPSGSFLVSKMIEDIDSSDYKILDLGAGTGVFSRAILKKGIDESRLVLVEINEDLSILLAKEFQSAEVLNIDIRELNNDCYKEKTKDIKKIICSLPLLNMKNEEIFDIMKTLFDIISKDGHVILFTYGKNCPIPKEILNELRISVEKVGFVVMNIPPAYIYKIKNRVD